MQSGFSSTELPGSPNRSKAEVQNSEGCILWHACQEVEDITRIWSLTLSSVSEFYNHLGVLVHSPMSEMFVLLLQHKRGSIFDESVGLGMQYTWDINLLRG